MSASVFTNVASATTDSVVIAAYLPGYVIRVFGLVINCGATATPVVFNSSGSSSTPISMQFSLGAYGSVTLPQPAYEITKTVWFETLPGEALTVTTGVGSTVGIQVVYDTYGPLRSVSVSVVANPFSIYSPTNVTPTISYDADSTSLDELANVLGSLINLFKTGTTITSSFTVTNVTTDLSFDAISTSLDELADVLGSLIASLSASGTSTDIYTTSNVTTTIAFDATSTSIDEVANVLGSVIASLQGVGKIL